MLRHADIPINELILRKYEKPYGLKDRELVRKLCLSLGLLQPGDSRDVIVDIFYVLLKARKEQKALTAEEITSLVTNLRKDYGLKMAGIAQSNVRRQVRRLKDAMLVEKTQGSAYRITEHMSLADIFDKRIKEFALKSTVERIEEYLRKVDEEI